MLGIRVFLPISVTKWTLLSVSGFTQSSLGPQCGLHLTFPHPQTPSRKTQRFIATANSPERPLVAARDSTSHCSTIFPG